MRKRQVFLCHISTLTGMIALAANASAAQRVWDGSNSSSWNNAFNWSGNAVPGNGDTASIGNTNNNAVILNANATAGIDDLFLSGGATLNTNGFRLLVDDAGVASTAIGNGSSLIVPAVTSGGINLNGLDADTLTVQSGGTFAPLSQSIIDDRLNINSGGFLAGAGILTIGDGSAGNNANGFNNNGTLSAAFFGASTLNIVAASNKLIDLDGTSGNGVVLANADGFIGGSIATAHLTIDGELSDAFSGIMEIGRRDTLTMTDPWTLDGRIEFSGSDSLDAATLESAGMTATAGANIEVTQGTAQLDVSFGMGGGTFTMNDNTTVWFRQNAAFGPAGILDLGADSVTVNIRADVGLQQPTVDLDGTGGDNHIRLVGVNGDTTPSLRIDGDLSDPFNGSISLESNSTLTLNGNATFAANSTFSKEQSNIRLNIGGNTTIATDIDLDGFLIPTTVSITDDEASLTINAYLGSGNFNEEFNGTLINRGTFTVNNPIGFYVLGDGGTLELRDVGNDPTVAGDRISNNGGVIFGNGRFTTRVRNNADGLIRPGSANFAGRLTWIDAELEINANSTVEFDLGGTTPGVTHDRIDAAEFDLNGGTLDLDLIFNYLPAMYLEHVLIDVDNGFTGVFDQVGDVLIAVTNTALAVTYTADQVLVQRALQGDANLDGFISQPDLDAVLLNWGENNLTFGSVSWVTGDLDGNGIISQSDLDAVLLNWGNGTPPSLNAIPEPATAGLLIGLLAMATRRNHR